MKHFFVAISNNRNTAPTWWSTKSQIGVVIYQGIKIADKLPNVKASKNEYNCYSRCYMSSSVPTIFLINMKRKEQLLINTEKPYIFAE